MMNHLIWITDLHDQPTYLLASLIQSFARHANGNTIIQLNTGYSVFTKTTPEDLERRLNTYYNSLLDHYNKKGDY